MVRVLTPSKTQRLFILIRQAICYVVLLQQFLLIVPLCEAVKNSHYLHWNTSNPIFRIDNTDHIIDVNRGNQAWEYDQVNIICPLYKPGTRAEEIEQYVIYSVSKEEYESCRITDPHPRVIAQCNSPHRLLYFTITFRSFTPTPGGMEFQPGQDYYFISTSAKSDLHRRLGGHCSTHNMKVQFKVADNRHENHVRLANNPRYRPHQPYLDPSRLDVTEQASTDKGSLLQTSTTTTTIATTAKPLDSHGFLDNSQGKLPRYYGDLSHYDNLSEKKRHEYDVHPNDIIKHEASRMAAATSKAASRSIHLDLVPWFLATMVLFHLSSLRAS